MVYSSLESPLLYGINTIKPKLPEGFKYIEREGHWLFAEGPDEKLYYVSPDKLYRMRLATRWDVVRTWILNWGACHLIKGSMLLDRRETIYIKHLQWQDDPRTKTIQELIGPPPLRSDNTSLN